MEQIEEKQFFVVFSPGFCNKTRKCESYEQAVEKARSYADSTPNIKFYICESIGGFKRKIIESEQISISCKPVDQ